MMPRDGMKKTWHGDIRREGTDGGSWGKDIWGWVKTLVPSEPQNSW